MKTWKKKEIQLTEWLTEYGPWVAVRKSRAERGEAVEDIEWGPLSVELKTRKSCPPQYLLDWLEQAKTNCADKLPIVVIHRNGMRKGNQLVCLTLADFVRLLKEVHDGAANS